MKKLIIVAILLCGFLTNIARASMQAGKDEVWVNAAPEVIFDDQEAPTVCARVCGKIGKSWAGDALTWVTWKDPADPSNNKCLCK